MKRSSLVCLFTACLLMACSKPPQEEFKIELRVDSKDQFKDQAINDKVPALEAKHRELLDAAIKACAFSSFLSESVRQQGGSSQSVVTSSTVQDMGGKSEVTTSTSTTIRNVELPGAILECHSGLVSYAQSGQGKDEGCRLKDADGSTQVQYPLLLQSLLQSRHGMKQNAILTQESISREKKFESSLKSTVAVSGDTLSCTKELVTQ